MHKKTLTIALTLLSVGTIFSESVLAINGINFFGLGARNRAMGGANCAAPVDTSTIYINPAGLGRIGNTTDFGAHCLIANRDINRTGAAGPIVNTAAEWETSGQGVYVTPFSGFSWRGCDSPWAFGMMIGGTTGEGASYDQPRINPDNLFHPDLVTPISATGDVFDTSTFVLCIKAVPAVSYEVTERLSVGAGMLVDVMLFSADLAVPGPGGTLIQTAGRGRAEVSYLAGFQVGALYDINDRWSVGFSYTSRQWLLDDYAHYEDLVSGFELPPEIRTGVAYWAAEWLRLTADYKFINWENVPLFENLPSQGGFGWRDQHTIGIGMEAYLTERIIGRLGWNYGKSPIGPDVTFANAVVPAIYESHLGGGVELKINQNHSLVVSTVGTFDASRTDNGTGDLFSQLGEGTAISYNGFDFDVTWSVRY